MKFIAICESDFPITEEVEEKLKNTVFTGNDYCFEITEIIDDFISELKGEQE